MPAPSPLLEQTDLTTISITSNGTDISNRYEILSIYVFKAVNRIPLARIAIRDGSTAEGTFAASESETDFPPGATIEISLGYHSSNTSIFSGLIVKHGIKHRLGSPSQMVLECRAKAIEMTLGRNSAYHGGQTDSDLMTALISGYGLTADVATTSVAQPWTTQFGSSDWDFLVTRAQMNGLLVIADGETVSVKAPDYTQTPALGVTYGVDILEFQAEMDAATQWAGVECSAWDMSSQTMLSAQVSADNTDAFGTDTTAALASSLAAKPNQLRTTAPLPQDALQAWAQAAMLQSELAKVTGKIRFQGSAAIAPGSLLAVAGLGSRFNGNGFVGAVCHQVEKGNWTTEATLGVDPTWFAAAPDVSTPAAWAQVPAVPGLQIGVVQKIDQDPAGQLRVQVTVPVVAPDGPVIWARLGTFYGTASKGAFFYPEIGDEVVLGFLDDDPRFPVILGSLYSSARLAPYTPDQPNTQKAIVTKSGLTVLFDDVDTVVTVQTPAGNKVQLSDKGQGDPAILLSDVNGNTVKFSSTGIEINSAGNFTVTAAQNISEQANAGTYTATGTQGVTVSGLKIALSADTEFTANGSATATLQSSGQTVVKGTMVMIN